MRTASFAVRSEASFVASHWRSSAVRNLACSGRSVITSKVRRPIKTVGTASAMYMICQPLRPNMPSRLRSAVDMGAPAATAIGRPTRKPETMRA